VAERRTDVMVTHLHTGVSNRRLWDAYRNCMAVSWLYFWSVDGAVLLDPPSGGKRGGRRNRGMVGSTEGGIVGKKGNRKKRGGGGRGAAGGRSDGRRPRLGPPCKFLHPHSLLMTN